MAQTEPTAKERERLRAAQAEAVMPLIGPLLDAWECGSQSVREEHPKLDVYLRRISHAMEYAEPMTPFIERVIAERDKLRAWAEEAVGYVGCETWSPSLKEEGEALLLALEHNVM